MNERIDELAKDCFVVTGSVHTDHFAYWKFAELIIFECIKLAVFKGDSQTGKAIKDHFGVE